MLNDENANVELFSKFGRSLDFSNIDFKEFSFGVSSHKDGVDNIIDPKDSEMNSYIPQKVKRGYWDFVQDEIYNLICTDSMEYNDLRASANEVTAKLIQGLTAVIATKLGGANMGIITTMLVVAFGSMIKVSKNAWCKMQEVEPL